MDSFLGPHPPAPEIQRGGRACDRIATSFRKGGMRGEYLEAAVFTKLTKQSVKVYVRSDDEKCFALIGTLPGDGSGQKDLQWTGGHFDKLLDVRPVADGTEGRPSGVASASEIIQPRDASSPTEDPLASPNLATNSSEFLHRPACSRIRLCVFP